MKKIMTFFYLLILPVTVLFGCSHRDQALKLTEVYSNNTLQTQGTYHLEHGTLQIEKTFTLSSNLNTLPSDIDIQTSKKEINQLLMLEFKKEKASDELFQTYQTSMGRVKMKKKKDGFTLKNKTYQKEFHYLNETKSRVADEWGIEYEVDQDS